MYLFISSHSLSLSLVGESDNGNGNEVAPNSQFASRETVKLQTPRRSEILARHDDNLVQLNVRAPQVSIAPSKFPTCINCAPCIGETNN